MEEEEEEEEEAGPGSVPMGFTESMSGDITVSEDLLDPEHIVGADGDLHHECLAGLMIFNNILIKTSFFSSTFVNII
jgi:hypothetical protein